MPSNKNPEVSLVPALEDLVVLSPQKIRLILETVNSDKDPNLRYATMSLLAGSAVLVVAILAFTFLVHSDHPTAAGVLLGTSVLGVITKIILARL
ncbi:hypothetical protein HDF16_006014 [Granulicella aggregans]|uniref:Uncharacterized protein n=1 Tax=Granulicella aggregans TaxID=474949 RepID=A0A7W8E6J5_9BACT|nr:hypothetical protein [Granulicella aggregans]MBB5061278.1 hypothetical protein [Granulicella aggregans]